MKPDKNELSGVASDAVLNDWKELQTTALEDVTELENRRGARLSAVLSIALVSLIGLLVIATIFRQFMASAQIGSALLLTIAARLLHRNGKQAAAEQILVWTVFVAATLQLWNFGGINPAVLLTYPCLLAAGMLLLPATHLKGLVIAQLAMTALVGFKNVLSPSIILMDGQAYTTTTLYALVGLAITSAVTILAARELNRSDALRKKQGEAVIQVANKLSHHMAHDQFTGLPNRVFAKAIADVALGEARQSRRKVAILFISLDNVSSITDEFGIERSEKHILTMSERIVAAVSAPHVVAKHVGDEFVVIAKGLEDPEYAALMAERIRTRVLSPVFMDDKNIVQSCSIGISVYPQDGDNYEILLDRAAIACRSAQHAGRNTYRFHNTEVNQRLVDNSRLVGDMKYAIERNELRIFYLPVFDIGTNTICGAEAVLRWQHPSEGLLSATRFLQLAEQNGDIVAYGTWAFQTIYEQVLAWQKTSMRTIPISFSVSVEHFSSSVIRSVMNGTISRNPISAGALEIVLPESSFERRPQESQLVSEFCTVNRIPLVIDNFGSGNTKLSLFTDVNVERVQIDAADVRGMNESPASIAIVKASIRASKTFKIPACAKGVDSEATLELVKTMGFTTARGSIFGGPMPPEEFEMIVQQSLHNNVGQILEAIEA